MTDPYLSPLNDWWAELRTAHAGPPPLDCHICAQRIAKFPPPADPPWPRFGLFWPWTRKARRD